MQVDGPGRVGPRTVGRTPKSASAKSGDFAAKVGGKAEEPSPPAVGASNSLGTVEALIAVQGVQDATQRAGGPGWQRAEDLLDRLEEIRHGILTGALSRTRLEALVQNLASRREANVDPRLAAVLDDIELRAKVELAKLSII